ncbi:hypothetical protein PIB30_015061 [Stylosanthes scabra]|uniref:Uncharacterized protein n=1 Tax=Stylosanthes scabra TaxID=79078 RepID=A0ABU6Z8M7_9FABA|nr:hypothetical protein [Stylosanthes scabra]
MSIHSNFPLHRLTQTNLNTRTCVPRFREPDRSLNRWTDWFKGLEVRPRSDRGRTDWFPVFPVEPAGPVRFSEHWRVPPLVSKFRSQINFDRFTNRLRNSHHGITMVVPNTSSEYAIPYQRRTKSAFACLESGAPRFSR